jgi:hypothetical protein
MCFPESPMLRNKIDTRRRSHRLGPWLLLAYQFVFLNVVLPGHTRGAITLDGKHTACPMCCCCDSGGGGTDPGTGKQPAPSQHDRDNCALCNFAARLTFVVPPNLRLTEFHLLEILPPAPSPAIVVCPPTRIDSCRGPPKAFA